jgi:hypothetical protein
MAIKQTFGATDWNEETSSSKKPVKYEKTIYAKLVNGNNKMRIATDPVGYIAHKFKGVDDPTGFGDWIKCSKPLHGYCPLCELGDKQKKKWYVGVISRKTGTYEVLDITSLIYDKIKKYNKEEEWGDPKKYDITIVRDDKAPPAQFYDVLSNMPKPLSKEDLAIIEKIDPASFERLVSPPDPDWVRSRIDALRAKRNLPPIKTLLDAQTAASETPVEEPSVTGSHEDSASDDEFSFR